MLKFFSKNQPLVMVLLPILLIAHIILALTFDVFINSENLDQNIFEISFNFYSPYTNFLSIGILFLNAFLVNLIFNSHQFWEKNTYLPSYIYVLFSLAFPHSVFLSGELIAQTFIILIIYQLYKLNQQQSAKSITFNIGLFLAIATICNPIYSLLLPCILICISVIRPFVFREYLLLLVGAIVPFIYVLVYDISLLNNVTSLLVNQNFEKELGWLFLAITGIGGFLALISIAGLLKRSKTSSIRFKKLRNIILYLSFFSLLSFVLIFLFGGSVFYSSILIVPLSFIIPYSYLSLKIKPVIDLLAFLVLILVFMKFFI